MMNERAERQINDVPYIVFEGEQARSERHIRRLIIALIVAVALLFLSNAFWLYEWTQYDYVGSEVNVGNDGNGIANYIGQDGDISYGEDFGKNEGEEEEKR